MLDRKTREHVDFLAARARRFGNHYINNAIIPILCGMVGVPTADVRGNITSHRARSTIASQLYNAKEPMTLASSVSSMPVSFRVRNALRSAGRECSRCCLLGIASELGRSAG